MPTAPSAAALIIHRGPRSKCRIRPPPARRNSIPHPSTRSASSPVLMRSGTPTSSATPEFAPNGMPTVRDTTHVAITTTLSTPAAKIHRRGRANSATARSSCSHATTAKNRPWAQSSAKCPGANAACNSPAPSAAALNSTSSGRSTTALGTAVSRSRSDGSSPSSGSRTSSDTVGSSRPSPTTLPHPSLRSPSMKRLGVLVPMEPELRPLAKRVALQRSEVDGRVVHSGRIGDVEIKATITSMGTTPAKAAAEFVLDTLDVDHVVLIGIAGGLGPDVHIGDLLVPEVVIDYDSRRATHPTPLGRHMAAGTLMTSGELILDPDILQRLADDGAAAIDMETSAVGAVCEDRGVPWSVFRGISDHIRDSLIDSSVSNLAKADGSANVSAVLKFVVTKPWRIPRLAKLGRDMSTAAKAAAGALVDSL